MSIADHFKLVIRFFLEQRIDYALIGAFALKAYGYTRATKDIDFITRLEYQSRIINHLESLGFDTHNKNEAFSNHFHSIGQTHIDFLYVNGKTADDIFSSIEFKDAFDGDSVPVPKASHFLALKLFAVKNNPDRKLKDYADIKALMKCVHLERQEVEYYARKYGQENILNELYR